LTQIGWKFSSEKNTKVYYPIFLLFLTFSLFSFVFSKEKSTKSKEKSNKVKLHCYHEEV